MISLNDISTVAEMQRTRIEGSETYPRTQLEAVLPRADFALIISGIRRCGKSTLLAQFLQKQSQQWLFLNFDTPKLFNFDFNDFQLIDDYLANHAEVSLLCFDEVQVVEGWEMYIRAKLDAGYRIVITGSNASLLSRELGTKLTGRHINQELFPFSYREFCDFSGIEKNEQSLLTYLEKGGFPQYLQTDDQEILHMLINDILYRDIAVRHNIRDTHSLKQLLMFLVANVGNLVSANKLKTIINVKSTATVVDYLHFFQDSYLIHLMPKFSYAYKKQVVNPKKLYFIDNGLQAAISPSFSKDYGRRLENLLFWTLRDQGFECYYYNENQKECDFVICKKQTVKGVIQACAELHHENRRREVDGLLDAMAFFELSEGFIITLSQRDKIIDGDKVIYVVPMYEWDEVNASLSKS